MPPLPRLITFDVFGTIVDWRRGLMDACREAGRPITAEEFEMVINSQAAIEDGPFRPYAEITAASLVSVLGLEAAAAERIGERVGEWPPYPDSPDALGRLAAVTRLVAMTNSDLRHGEQARRHLPFPAGDWITAEAVRVYKPSPAFWHSVAVRVGIEPGPDWWHASAYADYDLETAAGLGLTTVFVERPHAHPGPADITVPDLTRLADLVDGLA